MKRAGLSDSLVDGLCPADLFHYYDMHIRMKSRELRELLHVQVSAAAITADDKPYKSLDEALAKAGASQKTALLDAGGKATVPATDELSRREAAAAAASDRETDGLWTKRRRK